MGLDIYLPGSGTDFRLGSYSVLHWIRALALFTTGDFKSLDAAREYEKSKKAEGYYEWDRYPNFYHLLHFSDAEGWYLPEVYLEDVEYKQSFYLSNADELLRELQLVRRRITDKPEKYQELNGSWVLKSFYKLLNNLEKEKENVGLLMVRFH